MGILALRIIEKLLIIYFVSYFLIDVGLFFFSLFNFRKRKKKNRREYDYQNYSISIIVPSYNEEVSIIACTDMLLNVDYPNYEVIIVNDGSSDKTMETLKKYYTLIPVENSNPTGLTIKNIKQIYSVEGKNLLILDKENGGSNTK